MKRFIAAICLLASAGVAAQADYVPGSQTLSFQFGAGGTNNRIDWTSVSPSFSDERVADGGGAIGGQYIYFVNAQPAVGFGLDVNYTGLREHTSDDALPFFTTRSSFHPTTVLGIAKLAFPRGTARPYILGGLGFHSTSLSLSLAPQADTGGWADTGTYEERKVIDGTGVSVAAAFGVGIDFFPTESLLISLEYRATYLGSATYSRTPEGMALGFNDARSSLSLSDFLIRIGLKFGSA